MKRVVWLMYLLLVVGPSAYAQTLSDPQRVTLTTNITANGDTNALFVSGDMTGLAALLNATSSPLFRVWKTSVTLAQVGDNIVATELAGLSTINATRLQTIALYSPNGVNPSTSDRRAFFDDVFSGAGGTATRAKLLILWKRDAKRFERIFATGTGSEAVPGVLVVEGEVSADLLASLPRP